MKTFTLLLFFIASFGWVQASSIPVGKNEAATVSFRENKGQVHDQFNRQRTDVLFSGSDGAITFHLRQNGWSYQLVTPAAQGDSEERSTEMNIYRLDLGWVNANPNASIEATNALPGVDNFYLASSPEGALNVHSYEGVMYRNIYDGIDLKWYTQQGQLKYDYVVAAGADYTQIAFEIKGATDLHIDEASGALIMETPQGDLSEIAPVVTQMGQRLDARWVIQGGNIVSFHVEDVNPDQELIIDPLVRLWGTYYGGTDVEQFNGMALDNDSGYVYLAGESTSSTNIATSGAHQTTAGGSNDAMVVKFDLEGNRLWATHYGGTDWDSGTDIAYDGSGNLYLVGHTASSSGIATSGSHQASFGGTEDGFLVQFNTSGVRQWGTYYGAGDEDNIHGCALDAAGNVIVSGFTASGTSTAIASAGSHQTTFGGGSYDAFVAKFSASGVRSWGTYYGGSNTDESRSCTVDADGNIYFTGRTLSGTSIATTGSQQSSHAGNGDAFLVKLNNDGERIWGTYYGGSGAELGYSVASDSSNNLYITGYTLSASGIATTGAYDETANGGLDPMLVKFDSSGVRQWGTYYGGTDTDYGFSVYAGSTGLLLAGYTSSASGIASTGSYDEVISGSSDAFLVQFDLNGVRDFGFYYGANGAATELGYACISDPSGRIFLAGQTSTSTGDSIASSGSHQSTFGGGTADAFLVQFYDCIAPTTPSLSAASSSVCAGSALDLAISGDLNDSPYWYVYSGSCGGTLVDSTASDTVSLFPTANTTYYVRGEAFCSAAGVCDSFTVSLLTLPVVDLGNDTAICDLDTMTFDAGSFTGYEWNTTETTQTISATAQGDYSVTVTASNGCEGSDTVSLAIYSLPAINLGNDTVFCDGNSLELGADTLLTTYLWSTNESTDTIAVDTASNYWVEVTDSNGCMNSDSIMVSIWDLPMVDLGNDTSICDGLSLSLTADSNTSYVWSTSATTQEIIISDSNLYEVTVTDTNGCTNSDDIHVDIYDLPTIYLGPDSSYCGNKSLNAGSGFTYVWSDSTTGQTISVNMSGTYSVTITDNNGCQNADSINLTILEIPALNLGPNTNLCVGDTLVLDAGAGMASYNWNTSATTQTISVAVGGNYGVTVTGTNGCTKSDNIQVTLQQLPVVDLGETKVICEGENVFLNAGSGQASYQWSTGETSQIIAVSGSTYGIGVHTFTVLVTSSVGCQTEASVNVRVNDCLGVKEINDPLALTLFPNPVADQLTMVSEKRMDLRIMNTAGQIIWNGTIAAGANVLPVHDWAGGIYFIVDAEGRSTRFSVAH